MKYNFDISIERYKAKLVAQSFFQIHRIVYIEIVAPIIRRELLRIFLAIATILRIIFI